MGPSVAKTKLSNLTLIQWIYHSEQNNLLTFYSTFIYFKSFVFQRLNIYSNFSFCFLGIVFCKKDIIFPNIVLEGRGYGFDNKIVLFYGEKIERYLEFQFRFFIHLKFFIKLIVLWKYIHWELHEYLSSAGFLVLQNDIHCKCAIRM